jgi:hypothetical protein
MDIKSLAKMLTSGNISPEEVMVAVPMLLAEINSIRHNAVQLVDSLDNLKLIIEELVDEDRQFKPLKLD